MQLFAHVNTNGLVQIKLPDEYSDQDIDMVLVIQPREKTTRDKTQNWQAFVKKTYGCCADSPLIRPEQLPIEEREALL